MANVDWGEDTTTNRDRAQIILVTGLVVAVILVALVLLLNTVIYTENLATRGIDPGASQAIDFRGSSSMALSAVVNQANMNHESYSDFDELNDSVYDDILLLNDVYDERHSKRGVYATLSVEGFDEGYHVWEDSPSTVIPSGEIGNSTDDIRHLILWLDSDSLAENESDAFIISVGAEDWMIYKNETDSTVIIENSTADRIETGSIPTTVEIDFVNGTVSGEEYDELNISNYGPVSNDEIAFTNQNNTSGTYQITAAGQFSNHFPNYAPMIYRASAIVVYENQDISFETKVEVEGVAPDG